MSQRQVTIVQERLLDYRTSFFEHLRNRLAKDSVELSLVYAPDVSDDAVRASLPWATPLTSLRVGSITWQPILKRYGSSDLVIVPQQVRYPASVILQFLRGFSARRHAFWGHGSSDKPVFAHSLAQAWKRTMSTRVDWWFAYNDLAARRVAHLGYPSDRITSVMNSIDTTSIRQRRDELTFDEVEAARLELGITSKNLAIYTGSLRDFKRPEFLVTACGMIRELVPDFEMIVIGDGPDTPMIEAAAARWSWFHYVGRKNDMEKVPYWALSKLLLMPGGVGLVILDSFALGIPMVTTENRLHGPEVDYLRDGVNGLMVKPGDDPAHYADEVAALLRDDKRRKSMAAAALADRDRYSTEDMSQRFATGILEALEAPRYRVFF
jgi:glycosyltransferase involved in cell wall biosynthesis